MLLIFTVSNDLTTNKVIRFLGKSTRFSRINDDRHIDITLSGLSELTLRLDDGRVLTRQDIRKVWFRTGRIFTANEHRISVINIITKKEEFFFKEYLSYLLETTFDILGSISGEMRLNKLAVLLQARRSGLNIPFSVATNCRKITIEKPGFFVKPIGNVFPVDYDGNQYVPVYSMLDPAHYDGISIAFFQQYIDKQFEIRSFFLYGEVYSMAIFSQSDPETRLDFRNTDGSRPNRHVPFALPATVVRSVQRLMHRLKLKTGSIDFICSPSGDFVFLEVNPAGQIDWLSVHCNYYLEEKIARHLDAN